jgi:hypothetical protein
MKFTFLIAAGMLAMGLAGCEKPVNKPVPVVAAPARTAATAPTDAETLSRAVGEDGKALAPDTAPAPPKPGEPIHTLPQVK